MSASKARLEHAAETEIILGRSYCIWNPSHLLNAFWKERETPYLLLYVENKARKHLVPFLTSLVWCEPGSNSQPPAHGANALPMSHCWLYRFAFKHSVFLIGQIRVYSRKRWTFLKRLTLGRKQLKHTRSFWRAEDCIRTLHRRRDTHTLDPNVKLFLNDFSIMEGRGAMVSKHRSKCTAP